MRGTVLVVDSDSGVRQALRRVLAGRGYEVHVAHDVISAVYCARNHQFGFAIIEQNLTNEYGDCSGLALTRKLRELSPEIRVVIFTAHGTCDTAFRAALAGAFAYLEKPANCQELIAVVEGRPFVAAAVPPTLERVERAHILRVVSCCDGNLTRAAELLGVSRNTLRRKLADSSRNRH